MHEPDMFNSNEELSRMAGTCQICGRPLTDEVSVARGIGPVCAASQHITHPMNRENHQCNYEIVEDDHEFLVLRDIGPWDQYFTITNGAENVVQELLSRLGDRRLMYYDSLGDLNELLVKDGQFDGFKHVPVLKINRG